jgi:regulator of sirC expression with transglutaminase-like and TPR domain
MPDPPPPFAELAARPHPPLDHLALALAAEFREVDAAAALGTLDRLGAELAAVRPDEPAAQVTAIASLLGGTYGFRGDGTEYDHPDNSMLDLVLERRRGLPILLSVLYVEVARRADVALAGVGLPGHFVAAHFGATPALLLDPFNGGVRIEAEPSAIVRPWTAQEIAMRMLNNLVRAFQRRGDLAAAIHAATMRLALPADPALATTLQAEHRALQAKLN